VVVLKLKCYNTHVCKSFEKSADLAKARESAIKIALLKSQFVVLARRNISKRKYIINTASCL